jgi:hypothetical protein
VKTNVDLRTVDLSAYPDLVVIYLGMRVRTFPGIKTLLGLGPLIDKAGAGRPDGLLHYENKIIFRLYPLHLGMRWYWRDFGSMERWTRSEPHRQWWQRFMRDSGGTGFWHEVYLMRGGMEGVYADLNLPPLGFQGFARRCRRMAACSPRVSASGSRARRRRSHRVLPKAISVRAGLGVNLPLAACRPKCAMPNWVAA